MNEQGQKILDGIVKAPGATVKDGNRFGGFDGGAMIVAATPEIAALAKAALKGCKAEPAICLNNVGLQVAEAVTPGGVGAAGVIGVGKTVVEATAARAVAANAAHNATSYAGLKIDLKTTQAANEVVDSLRNTGKLPSQYVVKQVAEDSGWTAGKALGNYVPGGQIGGDIFENTTMYYLQFKAESGMRLM